MLFLGEKLWKVKDSRTKYKAEVCKTETKTNKDLEDLRVDLVRFLCEESLDVLIRDLMGHFSKLR